MDCLILFFLVFILILLVIIQRKDESFSSMPDIPMGLQWGSTPDNLYEKSEQNNYFGKDLMLALREADYNDSSYARGLGMGIGDINKKMDYGLHSSSKINYN